MEEAPPSRRKGFYYVGRIIDKSLLINYMLGGIYIAFGTSVEQSSYFSEQAEGGRVRPAD